MKNSQLLLIVIIALFFLAGCGETVTGVVRDTRRIGGGVRTIFVRD